MASYLTGILLEFSPAGRWPMGWPGVEEPFWKHVREGLRAVRDSYEEEGPVPSDAGH